MSSTSTSPSSAAIPRSSTRRSKRSRLLLTVFALVGWALLVLLTRRVGQQLIAERGFDDIRLGSAPLVGRDDLVWGIRTLLPITVGIAAIVALPVFVRRLSWGRLLAVLFVGAVAWPVALNLTRGVEGITGPLLRVEDEYLLDVPLIDSPGAFLDTFIERVDDYNPHVRSHPPGFILLLWTLDAGGLAGAGWAAALCISGGAAAAIAVLVALRDVAGEDAARRAAPFVVVAPTALWIATSADALYAGVGAWAVALLVLATGRARGRQADALSVGSGLLFGVSFMFSYGLALLALVALPVVWHRRSVRPTVIAVVVAIPVLLVFLPFGFNYLDGFREAQHQVAESVQATRPFPYFFFSNLAALAIACGPAVVVALTRVRRGDHMTWLLVGGALAAVLLADLSALSKGEVERIWLPFAVWILAAGACLVADGSDRSVRGWMAAQVLMAVVVQTWVRTGW